MSVSRIQTYGYLNSHKASPPIGWYQIILLADRSTCVLETCPGLHSTVRGWDMNLRPIDQHLSHLANEPHNA